MFGQHRGTKCFYSVILFRLWVLNKNSASFRNPIFILDKSLLPRS